VKTRGLVVALALILTACSFENKYEREADRITHAILNNNLAPVQGDIGKGINVSRVQVAEWSDELNEQGKLLSIKEVPSGCSPGWHCFAVKFEKHDYVESLRLDENGKVVGWQFHMAPASAQSAP
jgi:hypothetical protein